MSSPPSSGQSAAASSDPRYPPEMFPPLAGFRNDPVFLALHGMSLNAPMLQVDVNGSLFLIPRTRVLKPSPHPPEYALNDIITNFAPGWTDIVRELITDAGIAVPGPILFLSPLATADTSHPMLSTAVKLLLCQLTYDEQAPLPLLRLKLHPRSLVPPHTPSASPHASSTLNASNDRADPTPMVTSSAQQSINARPTNVRGRSIMIGPVETIAEESVASSESNNNDAVPPSIVTPAAHVSTTRNGSRSRSSANFTPVQSDDDSGPIPPAMAASRVLNWDINSSPMFARVRAAVNESRQSVQSGFATSLSGITGLFVGSRNDASVPQARYVDRTNETIEFEAKDDESVLESEASVSEEHRLEPRRVKEQKKSKSETIRIGGDYFRLLGDPTPYTDRQTKIIQWYAPKNGVHVLCRAANVDTYLFNRDETVAKYNEAFASVIDHASSKFHDPEWPKKVASAVPKYIKGNSVLRWLYDVCAALHARGVWCPPPHTIVSDVGMAPCPGSIDVALYGDLFPLVTPAVGSYTSRMSEALSHVLSAASKDLDSTYVACFTSICGYHRYCTLLRSLRLPRLSNRHFDAAFPKLSSDASLHGYAQKIHDFLLTSRIAETHWNDEYVVTTFLERIASRFPNTAARVNTDMIVDRFENNGERSDRYRFPHFPQRCLEAAYDVGELSTREGTKLNTTSFGRIHAINRDHSRAQAADKDKSEQIAQPTRDEGTKPKPKSKFVPRSSHKVHFTGADIETDDDDDDAQIEMTMNGGDAADPGHTTDTSEDEAEAQDFRLAHH
jgi:hypothetical protein